ncbi:SDH family Clp fold serine proteinase [Shewanella algae]|uniref:SDH family Clp fold serine proteinase n=1 Tax=Shewanella algae TaxID=38313 RepID=UPI0031F5937C
MADEMNKDDIEQEAQLNEEEKTYDLHKWEDVIALFRDELNDEQIKSHVAKHIQILISESKIEKYRVVFLFDDWHSISPYHSNQIYKAVSELNKKADILLVLQSGGGKIEPAYLISKTCKRLCKNKFNVSIPRRAKSAATLISLGAAELHMGLLSELGPIDPQFGGFPASGLANAMEKVAEMSSKFPKASDMFAKYLTDNLDIKDLGYFERINESAVQYAERLLRGKKLPENWDEERLAHHLTNHYKDHGFVIDSDEASTLLGKSVVKENTAEYEFGNKIYEFLDFLDFAYSALRNKRIRYVGSVESGLDTFEEPKK